MELGSHDALNRLMRRWDTPAPVNVAPNGIRRRTPAQDSPRSVLRASRKVRCKCGQCSRCLDDAKWERIFAEKFEDLDYYNRPTVTRGSSLTSY